MKFGARSSKQLLVERKDLVSGQQEFREQFDRIGDLGDCTAQ